MSSNPKKMIAIQHSIERFGVIRDMAQAALERDESRACLDAFCELMGLYVECTGGTLVTASLRAQLADIQTRVAGRSHLRAVPAAAEPEKPALDYRVETSDQCNCGAHVTVTYVYAGVFEALCERCWDPGEDSSEMENCRGQGPTPEEALREWRAAQDLIDPGPEFWPTDTDWRISFEQRRTTGWLRTETPEGIWFSPDVVAAE